MPVIQNTAKKGKTEKERASNPFLKVKDQGLTTRTNKYC
jgi:hypothetical protein